MASFIRMEKFEMNYRGESGSWDWWKKVNDSEEWQQGIFYTLSAAYAIVSFIALVQLFRIQMRVPEYGWTTQKVFHLLNFIVNGLRAVLFGFYKSVFLIRPKALEMVLLDLPGLLFFSTYTLLVLFWAEIYHQARSLSIDKLRPSYLIINGIVYFIQVCIWLYVRFSHQPIAVEVAKLFFSVISFFAALGFVIYGGRLFYMLRRFPIESKGRQNKLNEVGFVTGICCICFLIRCFVVLPKPVTSELSVLEEGKKTSQDLAIDTDTTPTITHKIFVLCKDNCRACGRWYSTGMGNGSDGPDIYPWACLGAHFNPAITIAFAVSRRFPWRHVPSYFGAQLLGSILATTTLHVLYNHKVDLTKIVNAYSGSTTGLEALIWEFIITFMLMFTVCGVATDHRAINELSGVAVGATVLFNVIVAGPVTGASMNPARSIGPALVSLKFDNLWIYIVAPVLGASAATLVYGLVRVRAPDKSEDTIKSV
ncbi:hypothetical protein IFM89_008545 [Coptis chinensis]|uniref:THH1/TOM1/TOM3 domain-containing protein n=1 Tax=Coptis chinensis TaxID=261450 RepID=A0A835LUS3_9MAGN|nr:hypothetical protein IFM89_008545 [Coptis chinensis]